jgi:hypothetical protein
MPSSGLIGAAVHLVRFSFSPSFTLTESREKSFATSLSAVNGDRKSRSLPAHFESELAAALAIFIRLMSGSGLGQHEVFVLDAARGD